MNNKINPESLPNAALWKAVSFSCSWITHCFRKGGAYTKGQLRHWERQQADKSTILIHLPLRAGKLQGQIPPYGGGSLSAQFRGGIPISEFHVTHNFPVRTCLSWQSTKWSATYPNVADGSFWCSMLAAAAALLIFTSTQQLLFFSTHLAASIP